MNPEHVLPGYEDAWYYLWKERRLPTNVDPLDSQLANLEDRRGWRASSSRGSTKLWAMHCLCAGNDSSDDTSAWVSGAWFFRPERMYLVPGDSPMGYRLPLDSIPWVSESEYPFVHEQDPLEERAPLPDRVALSKLLRISGLPEARDPQGYVEQILELGPVERRPPGAIARRAGRFASRERPVRPLDYSHGSVYRSTRRRAARFHAAAAASGRLSGAGGGGGRHGRQSRRSGSWSKAIRRPAIRA